MNYQVVTYTADMQPIDTYSVCSQAKTVNGVLKNVRLNLDRLAGEYEHFVIQVAFFYEDVECPRNRKSGTGERARAVLAMLPELSQVFDRE